MWLLPATIKQDYESSLRVRDRRGSAAAADLARLGLEFSWNTGSVAWLVAMVGRGSGG